MAAASSETTGKALLQKLSGTVISGAMLFASLHPAQGTLSQVSLVL